MICNKIKQPFIQFNNDELLTHNSSDTINFKLKIEKFTDFLKSNIKNNKLNNNITYDNLFFLEKKDNIFDINTYENNIFYEILKNKKIQEVIIEFDYIDDFKNIKTFTEFNKIYMDCKKYVEISENTKRVLSLNDNEESNINIITNDKLICLESNLTSRVMSRNNNFGGLKTIDFPFNPF